MRPELQKMLSHCGMADNSGLWTTLVCSNQQCSGPLYKGVRQSVSKKAELPTETGPINKWLPVKRGKKKPVLPHTTGLISQYIYFFCVPLSFICINSNKSVILKHCEQWRRIPSYFLGLSYLYYNVALKISRHLPVLSARLWISWKWLQVLFTLRL